MQRVALHFTTRDLVAGHFVLDFVNTVTARDTEPKDWLTDYGALLDWAAQSAHFKPATLGSLRRMAVRQPLQAKAALQRIVRLREALQRVLSSLVADHSPIPADLQTLDRARRVMHRRTSFAESGAAITARPQLESSGLDLIFDSVIAEAEGLLGSPPIGRLRICAGKHCGWWFFDSSKGGMRRWCDMQVCGNAEKSRRRARSIVEEA